jgi:hypothetical protein
MPEPDKLTVDQKIAVARIAADLIRSCLDNGAGLDVTTDDAPMVLFPETFRATYRHLVSVITQEDGPAPVTPPANR